MERRWRERRRAEAEPVEVEVKEELKLVFWTTRWWGGLLSDGGFALLGRAEW